MTENVRKYLSISFAVLTCIALILSLKISLVYIRAEELPGVAAYFENGFSFLNRNNLTIAHYLFDNLGVLAFKLICLLCVVSAQSEVFFLCRDCCVPPRTPSGFVHSPSRLRCSFRFFIRFWE